MEMNFSPNVVVSNVVITDPGNYFDNTEYSIILKNVLTYKTKKFKFSSGPGNRTWNKNCVGYSGFWSRYMDRRQLGKRASTYSLSLKKVEECPIGNQKYQQQIFDEFVSITDPPKFDHGSFRSCIFGDAQSGISTFNEFCSEFGYDTDSRRAYKIHKACVKTLDKLLELGVSRQTIEEFTE